MGMVKVELIMSMAVVFLSAMVVLGYQLKNKSKLMAAIVIGIGFAVWGVPAQQLFFLQSERIDEQTVVESWRLAEGGVSLKSEVSGIGMILPAGNILVPVTGTQTVMEYTVTVDEGDEGLRVKRLPVGSTTVHDDAKGWEDARVEKVLTAECKVSGTFFGIPVSDKKISGTLVPEYKIHIPKGTVIGDI